MGDGLKRAFAAAKATRQPPDPAVTIAALRREVATLRAALGALTLAAQSASLDAFWARSYSAQRAQLEPLLDAARAALVERPDGE